MSERDTGGPRNATADDRRLSPELQRRLQAAKEFCTMLKRAVTAYHLYADGHETVRDVDQELQRKTQSVLAAAGDLELQVRPDGFSLDGKYPVGIEETPQDSTAWPLYLDGVQKLIFRATMPVHELPAFGRLLRAAQDGLLPPGQTLATQFWETSFRGVDMVLLDMFAESRSADQGAEAELDAERNELGQLMDGMSAPLLTKPYPNPQTGRLPSLQPLELASLQVETLADLAAPDLAWVDPGTLPPVAPLNSDERWYLSNGLSNARAKALEGILPSFWRLMEVGTDTQRAELQEMVGPLVVHMLRMGLQRELGKALRKVMELAKGKTALLPVLEEFMGALAHPAVLPLLARDLDDKALSTVAGALLKFIPGSAAKGVLDILPALKTNEARAQVVGVLVHRHLSEGQLLERLPKWGPPLAPFLLQLSDALPPEGTDRVVATALSTSQTPLRLAAVNHLRSQAMAARAAQVRANAGALPTDGPEEPLDFSVGPNVRKHLLRLVFDPDAAVRQAVLDLFVKTRDQEAVGPLASVVEKDGTPLEERKAALRALCSLGGRQGLAVLRKLAQTESVDVALRVDAVNALGGLRDAESRPVLLAISGKFFVNRALKDACTEALKKLDARRGTGG